MLTAEELVLALVDRCGASAEFGRTSLQKVAYLVGVRLGWPSSGHQAHFYGPYSRRLEHATALLVRAGLVDEEETRLGVIGSTGYPVHKYSYQLSEPGSELVRELEAKHPVELELVRDAVDEIHSVVGSFDQRTLSLCAKVHFIAVERSSEIGFAEIVQEAKQLGWNLQNKQVQGMADVLSKLNLVALSSGSTT